MEVTHACFQEAGWVVQAINILSSADITKRPHDSTRQGGYPSRKMDGVCSKQDKKILKMFFTCHSSVACLDWGYPESGRNVVET